MQYYDANYEGTLTAAAVCTYGISPVGRLAGASGLSGVDQERYRTIISFNVPTNSIPANATIQSATLRISFGRFPYNVNQTAKLVAIPPGTEWSAGSDQLWGDSQNGTSYKTGIPANTTVQSVLTFSSGNQADAAFLNGFKNSITSNYFNFGVVSEQEGTNGSLSILGGSYSLTVDYSVPVSNYAITVQNDFTQGTIEVDHGNVSSPHTETWPSTSTHEAAAVDQNYQAPGEANYYRVFKSLWYKGGIRYATTRQISITPDASITYQANFSKRFNVSISSASCVEGGTGGTYLVNGTNVGAVWNGTFLQDFSNPIALQAVPPSGWVFVSWSDGNSSNPRSLHAHRPCHPICEV